MTQQVEYEFLKRKPRIFLVGHPKRIVLDEEKWYQATIFVSQLIFDIEQIPYGLHMDWFDETYYYYEADKTGISFTEQGLGKFMELRNAAKDDWTEGKDPQPIIHGLQIRDFFNVFPPIAYYAIPEKNSTYRPFWDRALNQFVAEWKRRDERSQKVGEGIKTIAAAHDINLRTLR